MRLTKNVVIDTNVFVSAALAKRSIPRFVVEEAIANQDIVCLVSFDTITELKNTLFDDKFNRYVSIVDRISFLNSYLISAIHISITEKVNDCRDLRDNKFLEVAVSGNADLIITGDKDLLELNPYRSIEILTPRDFLEPERKAA